MITPSPTPSAKKRYPRRNLDQRFDCFDEGCEECEVCKYRNFTDWAESVCGSDGTIERNTRIESYLKDQAESIQQKEKWAEQEMMKKYEESERKLQEVRALIYDDTMGLHRQNKELKRKLRIAKAAFTWMTKQEHLTFAECSLAEKWVWIAQEALLDINKSL